MMKIFRLRYCNKYYILHPYKLIIEIIEDIYYGIKNVIKYAPEVWFDTDGDWSSLLSLMKFKMTNMAQCEKDFAYYCDITDKNVKQMELCVMLMNRIEKDDYGKEPIIGPWRSPFFIKKTYYQDYMISQDVDLLFKTMNKYMRNWWN